MICLLIYLQLADDFQMNSITTARQAEIQEEEERLKHIEEEKKRKKEEEKKQRDV